MTHEEEKRVLKWLRLRPENPRHGLRERRVLQRALRGGEDIRREIRDALADWLLASPASMLTEERDSFVNRLADAKVTFRNDVELGSWNDPKPTPKTSSRRKLP
jgi:hypothetical protein